MVRTAVLRTVYVAGALTLAMLAPKATRLLETLDRAKAHRKELYNRIRNARYRLLHESLLEESAGKLVLTKKGTLYIEKLLLREYTIPEPPLWDGKWRILMFDIKEKRRRVRLKLRQLLQGVGFVRLQDSVWIYPYACDEFVALVRAHLASGVGELRIVTADAIEADRTLRDHFRLP